MVSRKMVANADKVDNDCINVKIDDDGKYDINDENIMLTINTEQ